MDQIITVESGFLLEYNAIKASLQNKRGRQPRWYKFLQDHLTLTNAGRLNISLRSPIIQNPRVVRVKPPSQFSDTTFYTGRTALLVGFWSPTSQDLIYGHLISSQHFNNIKPILYVEHWLPAPVSSASQANFSPHSSPNVIVPCSGCQHHFPYFISSLTPRCVIKIDFSKPFIINTLPFKRHHLLVSSYPIYNIRHARYLKHSHLHYRTLAYNDFLIQSQAPLDHPHSDSLLTSSFRRPPVITNHNIILINQLLSPFTIQNTLGNLASIVKNQSQLTFYTDSSYNKHASSPEFPMGFGWIISNLFDGTVTFAGACEFLASSTKAETMALLTALIICSARCSVSIYTDSLNVINTYYTSARLATLSTRKYQKICNNILWSAIHHIVLFLQLTVTFTKVKAHSGIPDNDRVDILANEGRFSPYSVKVDHSHILRQISTITWDNKFPLDHNIRKSIRSILQYTHIQNHLCHKAPDLINTSKDYKHIHWAITQKWFCHSADVIGTSPQTSKDLSWKIKTSTNTLPTLDMLNRNYPRILNGHITCLLCNNFSDSNSHFWRCPANFDRTSDTFRSLASYLNELIVSNGDSITLTYSDTIKYSETFNWVLHPTHFISSSTAFTPFVLLFLRGYVTNDLFNIFRKHFSSKQRSLHFIFQFMHHAATLFKTNLWKPRSAAWKEWKRAHNITKISFLTYRQRYHFSLNSALLIALIFHKGHLIVILRDFYILVWNWILGITNPTKSIYIYYFPLAIFCTVARYLIT